MQAVLDSSVPIAFLKREPGWELAFEMLPQGIMSPINVIEVATFLSRKGMPKDEMETAVRELPFKTADLCSEQMILAGNMIQKTMGFGLSLGDRSCIALGIVQQLPVLTADKIWTDVDLGVDIQLIR